MALLYLYFSVNYRRTAVFIAHLFTRISLLVGGGAVRRESKYAFKELYLYIEYMCFLFRFVLVYNYYLIFFF